ncbi:hypothetical protein I4F81_002543 [Pyropia yezoensis]|uniref:Uncharacterized protein n=1 Tax=Pyropia yezoensis TaxID=2788 RepID=A0ACC3BPP2_PYRYE|nr:hypothetical protein I4F81_002543 [Neopyropia yezoensis]
MRTFPGERGGGAAPVAQQPPRLLARGSAFFQRPAGQFVAIGGLLPGVTLPAEGHKRGRVPHRLPLLRGAVRYLSGGRRGVLAVGKVTHLREEGCHTSFLALTVLLTRRPPSVPIGGDGGAGVSRSHRRHHLRRRPRRRRVCQRGSSLWWRRRRRLCRRGCRRRWRRHRHCRRRRRPFAAALGDATAAVAVAAVSAPHQLPIGTIAGVQGALKAPGPGLCSAAAVVKVGQSAVHGWHGCEQRAFRRDGGSSESGELLITACRRGRWGRPRCRRSCRNHRHRRCRYHRRRLCRRSRRHRWGQGGGGA